MQMQQQQPGAFSYAAEPQAVPGKRSIRNKFRPEDEGLDEGTNIMYDKRVIRGSTYAAQVINQQTAQKEAEGRRREAERAARRDKARRRRELRAGQLPATPPPVPGRAHMEAQTETFLEELGDRPPEADGATQTEAFLERPPSPLFVPAKTGMDKETQIEAGDLFDFDQEVVPLLEVLVGKTLQLSMLEVMEEEELATLRRRQREFEDMRDAELAEVQRLEAEAKRRFAEKQRRVTQEREQAAARRALREKVAARSFTRGYLQGLHGAVLGGLEAEGEFADPVRAEIAGQFLPGVFRAVAANLDGVGGARAAAADLLGAALAAAEARRAERDRRRAGRARAKAAERAAMAAEEAAGRQLAREEAEAKAAAEAAAPEGGEGGSAEEGEES